MRKPAVGAVEALGASRLTVTGVADIRLAASVSTLPAASCGLAPVAGFVLFAGDPRYPRALHLVDVR